MILSGPYGDGFNAQEYAESIELAKEFFGYDNETCVDKMYGPKIFKQEQDEHGLEWTYNEGEGAIWDLLSVRATVSSGVKERFREELVDRLLHEYVIQDTQEEIRNITIVDYGCGIGREALVALKTGAYVIPVDLGKTLEFANFYANKFAPELTEKQWDPTGPDDFWALNNYKNYDAIMCFEYFEHEPEPIDLVHNFWDILRPGGLLICNSRSFNAHDTGHLERNFKFQFSFEDIIAQAGFKCLYFPWNPPNIFNITVWQKVEKGEGEYHGATTEQGNW